MTARKTPAQPMMLRHFYRNAKLEAVSDLLDDNVPTLEDVQRILLNIIDHLQDLEDGKK